MRHEFKDGLKIPKEKYYQIIEEFKFFKLKLYSFN